MPIVVGVDPGTGSPDALHLAGLLARSLRTNLIVATIVARSWVPSMARIDQEWQDHNRRVAQAALNQARELLGDRPDDVHVIHPASSSRRGLVEVAEQHGAELIVVGASAAGPIGRATLGSVSDALLHASPVPVAVSPTGFSAADDAVVSRVTAAYGGEDAGTDLVLGAAAVTASVGASLRIAAFAVRPDPDFALRSRAGGDSEDPVLGGWADEIRARAEDILDEVDALPNSPRVMDTIVGIGSSWAEAIDSVGWTETDVLVVGSSGLAPMARVFLGSHAAKVVRNAPVPVIVVPRRAAEELAERAGHPDNDS
ncbi:MAG: universal stress protein [Propionicimonas sp.]